MKLIGMALAALVSANAFASEKDYQVQNIWRNKTVEVQVVDYDNNQTLKTYKHQGKLYIAGIPGHRYGIQICNKTNLRTMSVVSVDGVNVVSGEDANTNQTGYVLNAYGCADIKGWRKSLNQVAEFVFTDPKSSYAGKTGRGQNTGIIGIATYQEKQPEIISNMMEKSMADSSLTGAASAPSLRSMEKKSELGTGHGSKIQDNVKNTTFEKDKNVPVFLYSLEYDTKEGLVRRGIIAEDTGPNPWPGQKFVPDPN